MGDTFWHTCLEVSLSIWLCLTSLRSSAVGRTAQCFQNMFWREATRRRNSLPKISPSPTALLLFLFVQKECKPQTLKPKCGPDFMAWPEEFHLEGCARSDCGFSEFTVETNDSRGCDGSRQGHWSLRAHYSPFLAAQLLQLWSCSLCSLRLQTTSLFSGSGLGPFPLFPVCFVLAHLSDFRVLILSLSLVPSLCQLAGLSLLEFSLLFWCSSVLDPSVKNPCSSPGSLEPQHHASLFLHQVCREWRGIRDPCWPQKLFLVLHDKRNANWNNEIPFISTRLVKIN